VGAECGPGAAGRWRDAATGEHGDLLDLIAANKRLSSLADTLDEARTFLSLPRRTEAEPLTPVPTGSPDAARRLWASGKPIVGTCAETYLRKRGIADLLLSGSLRFHPNCYWQSDDGTHRESWPALLAKVSNTKGALTGLHRTWLDRQGNKAPVETPRRAMGLLLGNAARFGKVNDVAVAGEGIETMLSIRTALPMLPAMAALSASHLAALELPPALRRLYIAVDNDEAGRWAAQELTTRATQTGVEVIPLCPAFGDFNDDLMTVGIDDLRALLRPQLAPPDAERLLQPTLTERQG
jgi:hypothetical protein